MVPVSRLVARNEPGSPGLFVNPDWTEGTPGTFAVVIGVSDYPFLDEGSRQEPGTDTFGLGQLHVSAATARRFFDWLAHRYGFMVAPPARCWLLLSPTNQELEAFGVGSVEDLGAAQATLENCEHALGWWSETMHRLPKAAADQSRGLFFFSGHGLEVWQDRQILLPSDYLRPPGRAVNGAISTANLRKGLASAPVPNQFLFVDACRNDVPRLREFVVEGREILNVRQAAGTNPDTLTGILYASATGTQTWQPRELAQGYSLFGGAVVDGLDGADGIELEGCDNTNCEIRFYPLQTYVRTRMAEALDAFNSTEKARVRDGGSAPECGITLIRARGLTAGAPAPVVISPEPVINARYAIRDDGLSWTPADGYAAGHAIFCSERMTDIWAREMRVHDLASGAELPREAIVVRSVWRSHDTGTFRIGIDLTTRSSGYWLRFADAAGQQVACVLSGDDPMTPRYELEIDLETENAGSGYHPRWVSRLEAGLSPLNREPIDTMARIWRKYETRNIAVAAADLDLQELETALRYKRISPLAATIAGLVLLRARRLDLLHSTWLRNLSDWFPAIPDAPVLWAEQLRLANGHPDLSPDQLLEARAEHLHRLTQRGLPRLSEVLPIAWRQLAELPEEGIDPPWRAPLLNKILTAMRYHRPGGLFTVFTARAGQLSPELMLPPMGEAK
jgi:hypothetical protein